MPHSKHIKGDRAELIAAEYFIGLGYTIERNLGDVEQYDANKLMQKKN